MYKLSDQTIGQISKLLQLAILTGTDIIDNLRTLHLTVVDDKIELEPGYVEHFEKNLEKMTEFASNVDADE